MNTRYIGITDFMTSDEVRRMIGVYYRNMTVLDNLRLHVGVMMSYKTMNGRLSKYTDAFPKKEYVCDIFVEHPLAFNVLHYADYEGLDVFESIVLATQYGGPNMEAIQLDMIWPNTTVLRKFRNQFPDTKVILQINSKALEIVNDNPVTLVSRIAEYGDTIDYVLLDKSMGKGVGMDASVLLPFVRQVSVSFPYINIAVAGGLGPDTMHLAEPIIQEFPLVSVDAQSRLRKSGSALDPIDWDMAGDYFLKAYKMIQENSNRRISEKVLFDR